MKQKLEELKQAIELETNECKRAFLIRFYNQMVLKQNRRGSAGAKLKVDSRK